MVMQLTTLAAFHHRCLIVQRCLPHKGIWMSVLSLGFLSSRPPWVKRPSMVPLPTDTQTKLKTGYRASYKQRLANALSLKLHRPLLHNLSPDCRLESNKPLNNFRHLR
jgi:hypothetical protein